MIFDSNKVLEVELGRYLDAVRAVLEKRPLRWQRVDV